MYYKVEMEDDVMLIDYSGCMTLRATTAIFQERTGACDEMGTGGLSQARLKVLKANIKH